MKKGIVSAVLVGVVVRLAVLAGAGDALGAWVRDVSTESSILSTALGMDYADASAAPEAEAEERMQPSVLLVSVTPPPP